MQDHVKEQAALLRERHDIYAPVFKGNPVLVKVLRKVILGIELSKTEEDLFKQVNPLVRSYIAKQIDYKMTGDEPLHFIKDFWMQFNLKDKPVAEGIFSMKYLRVVDLFNKESVKRVIGEAASLKISDLEYKESKDEETNAIELIARNIIISATDAFLMEITYHADNEPLTEDQIKEQHKKNSAR